VTTGAPEIKAHLVRAGCKKLIDASTEGAYCLVMGWGTFIAGQAIGSVRRAGRRSRSAKDYKKTADFLNSIINKRINTTIGLSGIALETEVLREIKRLKSKGEVGDIDAIREVVQNRFKTYHRLGPKLELEIIRISQIKALAGEEVNYAEIEREILDAPNKNFDKVSLVQEEFPSPSVLSPELIQLEEKPKLEKGKGKSLRIKK
jgi:hypothetical protein